MSSLHTPLPLPQATDTVSDACHATRLELDAFVDDEADATAQAAVVAHLARCERCRRAEQELRKLLAAVARARVPVLASRRLRLRVAMLFSEQQRVNG